MLAHILIVGQDSSLIETRAWVLQKAGFEATPTQWSAELSSSLRDSSIDLVVLCHSLSDRECHQLLAAIHSTQPAMRALVLTANTGDFPEDDRQGVLSAYASPTELIAKVRQMAAIEVAS